MYRYLFIHPKNGRVKTLTVPALDGETIEEADPINLTGFPQLAFSGLVSDGFELLNWHQLEGECKSAFVTEWKEEA